MKKVLGIDVGGTKIAAGLVDYNFNVTKVCIVPTSKFDLLQQLEHLISDYGEFDAIGLGMPGQVLENGTVTKLGNVEWQSVNLKKLFERKFKKPVSVINDAKAFALAEANLGQGKNFDTMAGVILGTGIGVGFIRNKKIYFGKDGLAGELEHVTMPDGRLLREHKKDLGQFKNAQSASRILKTLLDMIILSVNPEVVVLGGAWSKLKGMKELAKDLTTNSGRWISKTPVRISKLKFAGILGAALPLLKR